VHTHAKTAPTQTSARTNGAQQATTLKAKFTPVHAHTTHSASAFSTPPPVQFKGFLQSLCCPTEAGPTTVDQPKPAIPEHLQQPVKPTTDAPKTQERQQAAKAQSTNRRMKSQERQQAAAVRSEQRTARRAEASTRKQSKQGARAHRTEARASRKAARKDHTEHNQTARRASIDAKFGSAKAAIPQDVRQHFKKTRLRFNEEQEEEAG
jgi:hypothetical protein